MKKERIPFDIKYRPDIEDGKYLVQTRAGDSVRIVCWDRTPPFPSIIALAKSDSFEGIIECYNGGKCDIHGPSRDDLFLVPNPDYKEPTTTCSTSVDWDAFRREAALQIAAGFAANGNFLERSIGQLSEDIADCAVVTADILIKKLKGE